MKSIWLLKNQELPTKRGHQLVGDRSLSPSEAMMDLTGKEQFADWVGARVTFSHTLARNGNKTIEISAPK